MTHIVISGGGLVGCTTALLLSKKNIPCTIIDPQDFTKKINDSRTVAVHYGSKMLFEQIGLWDTYQKFATPIETIRVFEQNHAEAIHYHAADLGKEAMGYILEHSTLIDVLRKQCLKNDRITVIQGKISSLTQSPNRVSLTLENQAPPLTCDMLIACDGKNSFIRDALNFEFNKKDLEQTALVAHLTHEKPHNNQAWEVFTQTGPFALLPFRDAYTSGLVWCKPKGFNWEQYDNDQLCAEMAKIFPYYGDFSFTSKRFTYPLACQTVNHLVKQRVVLIGDAAHTLHPIAGQGVNLGWQDADLLTQHIQKSLRVGESIPHLLHSFSHFRRRDIRAMRYFTSGIPNCS